jgi:hypothetical protein
MIKISSALFSAASQSTDCDRLWFGIEMFCVMSEYHVVFCSRTPTRWKGRLLQEVSAEIRPWIGSLSKTADFL